MLFIRKTTEKVVVRYSVAFMQVLKGYASYNKQSIKNLQEFLWKPSNIALVFARWHICRSLEFRDWMSAFLSNLYCTSAGSLVANFFFAK